VKRSHRIENTRCSECGWQGPCQRHRLNPEEGYTKENMVILCPNDHALIEAFYLDPETRFGLTEKGKEALRLRVFAPAQR